MLRSAPPSVTLGLIADPQYADVPDGSSFDGKEQRCFRRSLEHCAAAGAAFRAASCALVLHLGDAIDGRNASKADVDIAGELSRSALADVFLRLRDEGEGKVRLPLLHVLGNHECLNFSRSEIRDAYALPPPAALSASGVTLSDALPPDGRLYYSARLPGGWRLIVLDAYDIAVGWRGADRTSAQHNAAVALLRAENPNEASWNPRVKGDYFAHLEHAGVRKRFVPFNGAVGPGQLEWLQRELAACVDEGDSAIVALHTPIYEHAACTTTVHTCLLHNYDVLLSTFAAAGCVSLVLSGHLHEGAFGVDAAGTTHITLESPLTHPERGAHALLHVFSDRLELEGCGTAIANRTVAAVRKEQPADSEAQR